MTSYDVVVVGAGVVGAAAAAALADASLSVAVVTGGERTAVSATAASGGLVRCYETDPAQRALALRSHELLWRRAAAPGSAGHHRTGSLVCLTADEAEKADLAIAGPEANDVPARPLEPAQEAPAGPHLRARGLGDGGGGVRRAVVDDEDGKVARRAFDHRADAGRFVVSGDQREDQPRRWIVARGARGEAPWSQQLEGPIGGAHGGAQRIVIEVDVADFAVGDRPRQVSGGRAQPGEATGPGLVYAP